MVFTCVRRGCTAEDHLEEYRHSTTYFSLDRIKRRLVDMSYEQISLLQKFRLNWLSTKNPVYMFLSGSVVVECLWEEAMCKQLDSMKSIGLVDNVGVMYYIPNTLFLDEVVENLPTPEVSEEEYEIKKFYIVSLKGVAGDLDVVDNFVKFFEKSPVFITKKIIKIIKKVPYIPQLTNKYTDRIDILLKSSDGSLIGMGYVDITKTYHMGFSIVKNYLMYGLDKAILLHPYIDQSFHKEVANRIKNRWDISEVGYAVVNLMEEEMYIYKLPRPNRYLRMSLTTQKNSSLIRNYIESL